ncbi:MAG: hypothetical protein KJZ92_16315 [Rhodocyclaceae bacterium]|jgi:hypothetical protein|nr:hypothetical protein [Rhodocyclaceae bacterium]MCC6880208.1 hypothetical protein [Rhodocyclaceae bacterium]MCL4682815.1 hypothetical protein [Rhodocyclaceae bacterium]
MKHHTPALRAGALALAAALAGCAAPQPLPFRLIDPAAKVHRGTLFPQTQRLEVAVDGLKYGGFYIVATGVAISHPMMVGPFFAPDTVTTYSSNQARAHLTAEGGPPLNCQFLFDGPRAVGECRTPEGKVYQLVAEGR